MKWRLVGVIGINTLGQNLTV